MLICSQNLAHKNNLCNCIDASFYVCCTQISEYAARDGGKEVKTWLNMV